MTTPTWYSKALAENTFATAAQAVPTGGTTGQILAKSSGTNYAVEWIDASAAQVQPDWDATSGMGQILNKPTLGTAAAQDVSAFATAAQGTLATNAVPNTRKVNGKALSADVTLAASDVGALTQSTADGRYATTAQGAKADSALQSVNLTNVPAGYTHTQHFTSSNYSSMSRATSRTDVIVMWVGDSTTSDSTLPTNAATGDPIVVASS